MIISICTLFPKLYTEFINTSLIRRAAQEGLVTFDITSLLSWCAPKERADGPTFGHEPGMVIRPEVIERAVRAQDGQHGLSYKIFFSPRGRKVTQTVIQELYEQIQKVGGHVSFFPARYEGMDARVEEEYTSNMQGTTLSVGDMVLMGGDIPTQMVIEALLRYIPGVVGKKESMVQDSFMGPFVDCPAYTAPVTWHGREVPQIIRSGDHRRIREWCTTVAVRDTVLRHFNWIRSYSMTEEERTRAAQAIPPHYVALMHDQVLLPQGIVGTTSITSLDIHDIARSSKTFGIRGFFIVTPLLDQQKIAQTLLQFWREGSGTTYNPDRHAALATTQVMENYEAVIATIEQQEGARPLTIVTSARPISGVTMLHYTDQEIAWSHKRPVLIILGTGHGLSPELCSRADYAFHSLQGFSHFNHLSVRSAAAIILDRWLGIQAPLKAIPSDCA